MPQHSSRWAIVLAGGAGTRLHSLTVDRRGRTVPKQFCALLSGGPSLLQQTLARAAAVVPRERVLVVVNADHRSHWQAQLADVDPQNVIVQPEPRGTAAGLMLPLLTILERDPDAVVAVFPSDHSVVREDLLRSAVRRGFAAVVARPSTVALLGIVADGPETEYGWIVTRPSANDALPVASFVEKPTASTAEALFATGAMWNSLVLVAGGRALRDLAVHRVPDVVGLLAPVVRAAPRRREAMIEGVYRSLRDADFSRHVLQGAESRLSAIRVPPCGWSDLGTPGRVHACLTRRAYAKSAAACAMRTPLALDSALRALGE